MTLSRLHLPLLTVFSCIFLISGLPTSLVEDVKDNEVRNIKVKRAHDSSSRSEKTPHDSTPYFSNPTAIKRGTNFNEQVGDWDQDQNLFQNSDIPSSLYDNDQLDDKSIAEYEKGYRYGTSKDKLDEALENAVLKSELYGDPVSINQYRYYGGVNDDKKRRRRSNGQKIRYDTRIKREADLSSEDILALLSLMENERQHPSNYRNWQKFNSNLDIDKDNQDDFEEEDEGTWLDSPVYPHLNSHSNSLSPNYYYERPQSYDKHNQWNGMSESKKKRFMVARKKNDPTRELRYLNGPNVNDYYTLSQLLGNQREANVPVYHRHIL